jgi:hypothetical protein
MGRSFARHLFVILVFSVVAIPAQAQFHERREQRLADSEKQNASAEELKKATEVTVALAFDKAWDTVVQILKTKGIPIDKADKDIAQIKTEFQITNPKKPLQHGMRYLIDFRKLSDSETGVRVAALEQTRHNIFQPDPWGEPKFNAGASDSLTREIQEAAKPH